MAVVTKVTYANRDFGRYISSWSYSRKVCIRCKEIFCGKKMVRMCNSCRFANKRSYGKSQEQ